MSSIFDLLTQQVGGAAVEQLTGQMGVDRSKAQTAVPAVMATLMGALAKNAGSTGGAEALSSALSRDHDGSILDNLSGFLGNASSGPGEAILKHVLGGNRANVESRLGQTTGLDASSVTSLLTMLAPVVLGALGKAQRSKGLDASGLASLLGNERDHMERSAPGGMGLLGKILDTDGDGQIADDVAKLGSGIFKKFLGGR